MKGLLPTAADCSCKHDDDSNVPHGDEEMRDMLILYYDNSVGRYVNKSVMCFFFCYSLICYAFSIQNGSHMSGNILNSSLVW